MDQISRPLLIALVAVVGFAGAWMLVLRPKASGGDDSAAAAPPAAVSAPGPKAPGQAGLERSVDKAHGAVAASEASAAKAESAAASVDDTGAVTPAASGAAATPSATAAGAAASVPAAAAGRQNASPAPDAAPAPSAGTAAPDAASAPHAAAPPKVAVAPKPAAPAQPAPSPAPQITLLLFTGNGADDAVAREVVRSIHAPHVKTIVAPIAKVSDYSDLVGSVEIPGTPTILVIGTDHKAQRIVGLPDEAQVRQALAAAR